MKKTGGNSGFFFGRFVLKNLILERLMNTVPVENHIHLI
jgi:hypothetical protein